MNIKTVNKILNSCFICLLTSLFFSWTTPLTISGGGINTAPFVFVNENDNCLLTWTNGVYPDVATQVSFYDGFAWSSPTTISDIAANVSPLCGMDSSGNSIAIWESINGSDRTIMSAQKPTGSAWTIPITLSTSLKNSSSSLAVNASGQIIAGWIDLEQDTIQVINLFFGESWSPVSTISLSGGNKGNLNLGIDALGNGIATWNKFDSGNIFYSQTITGFNSSWSAPLPLTDSGINIEPILSVEPSGNAIVAWTNIENYSVAAAIYENGNWLLPIEISNNYAAYPSVAVSGTDYFVSWKDLASGGAEATANISGTWDTPFILADDVSINAPHSCYSMGAFFTSWINIYYGEINVCEYSTNGSSSSPVVISDGNLNFSNKIYSSATMTVSTWEMLEGTDQVIQVSTIN